MVQPQDRGRPAKGQLLEAGDFSQLIRAGITKPRLQQKCLMSQEIADDLRLRIATRFEKDPGIKFTTSTTFKLMVSC